MIELPLAWLPGAARALLRELHSPAFDLGLLVRWLAQNLFASALVFLSDFLFGSAVLHVLERGRGGLPPALRAAAALAAGLGLAGTGLFWLGMAGWLTPWAPLALTAAAGLAGAALLQRRRAWQWAFAFVRVLKPPAGHARVLASLAVLLAAPFLLYLVDLAMPVTEFDAMLYHMTAARQYRESGSIAYDGDLRYNAHAHLNVLLLLRHWSILGDDAPAKMVNLEYGLMFLLVLIYAAREMGWKSGWMAGALFAASSPLLSWASRVEYADLPLAACTAVAAALLFHRIRRRVGHPAAAGLALGTAAAIKLQGHVLAACFLLAFAGVSLAARRDLWKTLRTSAVAGVVVVALCAGWWVRSWRSTGSPAYPFFVKDQPDVARMVDNDRHYGRGRDWRAFLLIPWHMYVGPPGAFADPFTFGPAGLMLAAAAVGAVARRRAAPPPEILFLSACMLLFLVFWFFTSQVMRYLLSLLPAAAIVFLWLLRQAGVPRRLPLFTVVLLAVFPLSLAYPTGSVFRYGILPGVTHAQRSQALAAALPYYHVLWELNRRAGPGDRTYLLFCPEDRYYAKTRSAGDWYGDHTYAWLASGFTSAAAIPDRLRAAGFRWLVVSRENARRGASVFGGDFEASAFVNPEAPLKGVRVIHSDRKYAVFQLW